ncbi:ankyrin repeat-containing domain protein, partial [Desarmillaria ectypa]
DHGGRTPLICAVDAGSEEVIQLLFQSPSISGDINTISFSSEITLSLAVHRGVLPGDLVMVKLLLDADGMVAYPICRTCSVLARVASVDIARFLLTRPDIQPDRKDENYPLSRAAQGGYTDVVTLLIQRNDADVNTKDGLGMTPL